MYVLFVYSIFHELGNKHTLWNVRGVLEFSILRVFKNKSEKKAAVEDGILQELN